MSEHSFHHYVPRFLLKNWTTDKALIRFQWIDGKMEVKSVSTRRVAGQHNLYTLRADVSDNQFYEREVMGNKIDNPAANIVNQIIAGNYSFNSQTRSEWTRFLISMRIRVPHIINDLREAGAESLTEALLQNPEEYEVIRASNDPASLLEYVRQKLPNLHADIGIRVLPDILQRPILVNSIFQMHWCIRSVKYASHDLIISDNPLVIVPSLNSPNCILALPISPRLVFIACRNLSTRASIQSMPESKLVKLLNRDQINQAQKQIYATDTIQLQFIQSHFKN